MGMRQIEAEILKEARTVTGMKKLRQKDIQEWRTGTEDQVGTVKKEDGEKVFFLPVMHILVWVLETALKSEKKKGTEK